MHPAFATARRVLSPWRPPAHDGCLARSYWIPGSEAPALSKKGNAF
jgi:hypothetical protein